MLTDGNTSSIHKMQFALQIRPKMKKQCNKSNIITKELDGKCRSKNNLQMLYQIDLNMK